VDRWTSKQNYQKICRGYWCQTLLVHLWWASRCTLDWEYEYSSWR